MRRFAEEFFAKFSELVGSTRVTEKNGESLDFYEGIEKTGKAAISQTDAGGKLIFIGNGGSAAVASHMAVDFWKVGRMKATAFNDSSLLTCIANDYGYEHIFEKPIEMFAEAGDVLFAISSSGRSENILRGVVAAELAGCLVITLSGFKEDNPLRSLGDLNFYVPSSSYGLVESLHQTICHCILDAIVDKKEKTNFLEEKVYE